MMKKLIKEYLKGMSIGLNIGFINTIIASLIVADGNYHAVSLQFISTMGTELSAVIMQAILCAFLGGAFSLAGLIWTIDKWSIAKQGIVYFATVSTIMFPVAYITNWMHHSIKGFIMYYALFTLIFIVVWIIQYVIYKNSIKTINDKINSKKS